MPSRQPLKKMIQRGVRGSVNPVLAHGRSTPADQVPHSVVVAGAPRSGTTWLAELLAEACGAAMLFEPFHPECVPAARMAGYDWNTFVPLGADWPEGRAYARKALAGRICTPWTLGFTSARSVLTRRRWVVKCVRANMFLPWLAEQCGMRAAVLLVRHPCAVIASHLRQGWVLKHPPICPEFFDAYPHTRKLVQGLTGPEEYLAALWSMRHFVPLQHRGKPWLHVVCYEHLVMQGADRFQQLMADLQFDRSAANNLDMGRPSQMAKERSRTDQVARALGAWQHELSPDMVRRILNVVHEFGLALYNDDLEPDDRQLRPLAAAPVRAAPKAAA